MIGHGRTNLWKEEPDNALSGIVRRFVRIRPLIPLSAAREMDE
jgi:hypothetical protein